VKLAWQKLPPGGDLAEGNGKHAAELCKHFKARFHGSYADRGDAPTFYQVPILVWEGF